MALVTSLIRTDVITACRDPAVAAKAGVGSVAWADTVVTRVFAGTQGYMFGRNRGRLPFLEVACNEVDFSQHNVEGGVVATAVSIRCHVGAGDQTTADDLTGNILLTCLAKIRSRTTVTYLTDGEENLAALVAGPWGLMRDLTLTVRHVYDRANYGAT